MRLWLLITLLALGQASAPAAQSTGRISGVVVEEGTETPVAEARITLFNATMRPTPGRPPVPQQALSDASGHFSFDGLDAGAYNLSVTKSTYAASLSNARASNLTLGAGQSRDTIHLALVKGAIIAGRVVDAAGQPVIDARVTAMRAAVTGAAPTLIMGGQPAQTNDLGEYRLFGLPPGEYFIQAGPRAEPLGGANSAKNALVPTYYGDTRDLLAARAVSLAAAATAAHIDIALQRTEVFTVSGVVVDEQGATAGDATVTLLPAGGGMAMVAMNAIRPALVRDDGRFEVTGVVPGEYFLTASSRPAFPGGSSPAAPGVNGPTGFTGSVTSGGIVSGSVSSSGGGGTITGSETRNGVTIQYRTQQSERIPVSVSNSDVVGIRLTAPRPQILSDSSQR